MEKELQVYNGGHMLNEAMVAYRNKQAEEINSIDGIKCYNVLDDKSINDKANAVQEGLAERILNNDYGAMYDSDAYIFDILPEALGTICELGILLGMKRQAERTFEYYVKEMLELDIPFEEMYEEDEIFRESCDILKRPVYIYCSDIRQGHDKPYTDPDRAEFSTNQFVYGAVLSLTDGEGFITWEEVKERLVKDLL